MKRASCNMFIIGIMGGVGLALAFVNPHGEKITFSNLVLQLSGSRGDFALGTNLSELLSLTMRMFPNFVFELCVGTELYRHFCTANVYIFSRTPQRLNWYGKELCSIAISALLYQFTLMLSVVCVTSIRYQLEMDLPGLALFLYHFFIYFLWVYSMTLWVNLLSIVLGSDIAFQILVGVQIVLISLLLIIDGLEEQPDLLILYINLNPISRMILGWHSGGELLSQVLMPPYSGLDLNISLLYIGSFCAISMVFGAFLIKNHDFLTSNLEEEA